MNILLPALTFLIGFIITFNLEKEPINTSNIKQIINSTPKQPIKEQNKTTQLIKKVEDIPSFIKNDFDRYGLSSENINEERWLDFLAKLKFETYSNIPINSTNNTFLHFAAKNGSKELVYSLLNLGYDLNKKDNNGYTPIMYAISNKLDVEFIKDLVAKGADIEINQFDKREKDLLSFAIGYSIEGGIDEETVDFLLDSGLEFQEKHLVRLISHDGKKAKKYLIRYIDNMKINDEDSTSNFSDSIKKIIINEEDNEIIKHLIDTKIDFKTYGRDDLLLYSSMNKHISKENFEKILKSGNFDVNKATFGKVTALMTTVFRGNIENAKLLLENGAKVNLVDTSGNTAYQWLDKNSSLNKEEREEIITLLNKYK